MGVLGATLNAPALEISGHVEPYPLQIPEVMETK